MLLRQQLLCHVILYLQICRTCFSTFLPLCNIEDRLGLRQILVRISKYRGCIKDRASSSAIFFDVHGETGQKK
jgi:hypothetical protein